MVGFNTITSRDFRLSARSSAAGAPGDLRLLLAGGISSAGGPTRPIAGPTTSSATPSPASLTRRFREIRVRGKGHCGEAGKNWVVPCYAIRRRWRGGENSRGTIGARSDRAPDRNNTEGPVAGCGIVEPHVYLILTPSMPGLLIAGDGDSTGLQSAFRGKNRAPRRKEDRRTWGWRSS